MKRTLLALAIAAVTAASAYAAPAMRIHKNITQPDGSVITVTLTGDERFHSYVTSDGLAVDINDAGHAVYRTSSGPSAVYAHELAARTADEKQFIAAQGSAITYDALRAQAPLVLQMNRAQAQTSDATATNGPARVNLGSGDSQVPHTGAPNVPVILVQYTNIKFKDGENAHTTFEDFCNTGDKSVNKYFKDMSLGQYDPQFKVLGPYTLSNPRSYYGGNNWAGNDQRVGEMVKEGCQLAAADPDVDFSIFDNDGDGKCDVVIVLYAGVGEASSGVRESVWPCQWSLSNSGAGAYTTDGVQIDKFAVFNEINGTYQSRIDGPGTFCHEFSHCLGLPDFYETTNGNGYFGMNAWSLMDYGCYNNNGYTPCGYTAYEKAFMGWMDLTPAKSHTKYTLPAMNDPENLQNNAIVVNNDGDPTGNEYFIFESRAKHGWDAYMADEGMLITHVTYSSSAWKNNTVNNSMPQRMTIVPADNALNAATISGDLWPSATATEFSATSTPAATVNKGGTLGHSVTEIARNASTNEVSFWFDRDAVPALAAPVITSLTPGEEGTSFVAAWTAEPTEEIEQTITLEAWPANLTLPDPELLQDFSRAKTTWTKIGSVKEYQSYITLGSISTTGSITSPAEATPGESTFTIFAKAKSYAGDAEPELVFTLLDEDGNEVATNSVVCDKTAKFFSVTFTDLNTTAKYAIRVANRAAKKRVTVYNVIVFDGYYTDVTEDDLNEVLNQAATSGDTASAPARVPETTTAGSRIIVKGISDTQHTIGDLEPMLYHVRAKAVPVDPDEAKESQWSETVDILLKASGIMNIEKAPAAASYRVADGIVFTTKDAHLYTPAGIEVSPVAPGRFAPPPGAYILAAPGMAPAKLLIH